MNTERFLSINQLSKIYNLPDITLYRDFKKLLKSNIGNEGTNYIKYFKDPRMNKFEWRIDPVWFENSVDRKLKIYVELDPSEDGRLGSEQFVRDKQYVDNTTVPSQDSSSLSSDEDSEGTSGIRSWLMEKIDELTEMLKNSQVLLAQKDKQIESLQKKVLQIEEPVYANISKTPHSPTISEDIPNDYDANKPVDENIVIQTVSDEVEDEEPDHELHENISPYDLGEHEHNELLTSLSTLENIVTDDGEIDTTEIEQSHDMDTDPWQDESEYVVPDNPNVRGGESDPRVLDSENEPIDDAYTDEDAFTRIARERDL